MEDNEIHYLSDEVVENLVPASMGKRLVNLIVDYIFMYALIVIVFVLMIWTGLYFPTPNANEDHQFAFLFLGWVIYVLTMFGLETILKGKSIGKLITRTRAVNEVDGSRINVKTAFMRSVIRTVPFEFFSALGTPSYPWHDKWTNTLVVND